MDIGLVPGHTVLHGDPGLQIPQKGHSSPLHFSAHFALARSPISATTETLFKFLLHHIIICCAFVTTVIFIRVFYVRKLHTLGYRES